MSNSGANAVRNGINLINIGSILYKVTVVIIFRSGMSVAGRGVRIYDITAAYLIPWRIIINMNS